MTLSQAFDLFRRQKEIDGLNDNSITTYCRVISLFLDAVGRDLPVSDLTYDSVADYIIFVRRKGVSRATVATYVRNVKIFLRWLDTEERLSFNPLKIKVPKSPKKQVHQYSDSEIRLIFDTVKTTVPWITARNRAIIALMLDSGIRQCEVVGLLQSNIDREKMVMKITGKGAKDRMVSLGVVACQFLDYYLSICPYRDGPQVFYERRGQPITGNCVRVFVNRLQNKLGFELSSHKLRHNFATNYCLDHIRKNGQSDVYNLSILMGHESIETTKRYEHFAHEIVAAEGGISHLDHVWEMG